LSYEGYQKNILWVLKMLIPKKDVVSVKNV
jgi:hypothetical protein